jgi:hypothetical protein
LPDDLFDLLADGVQGDAQRFQRLGGDAFAFVDEPEQDVLGADVVVVEHPRLFLGEDDHAAGAIRESLEHSTSLVSRVPFSWSGPCRDYSPATPGPFLCFLPLQP